MAKTVSYSTRSSKSLIFGLTALVMAYLLLRSAIPAIASLGDYLAVLISLGGATLARQQRETVVVRAPSEDRERTRLRWSYIIAAIGGLLGLAAVAALIATLVDDRPTIYWLVAAGLLTLAMISGEIAERLYEPFVIRTAPQAFRS